MGPYEELKNMALALAQEFGELEEDENFSNITISGPKGHRDTKIPFHPGAIIWAFNVLRILREAGGGKS